MKKGISALTRLVSDELDIPRALIFWILTLLIITDQVLTVIILYLKYHIHLCRDGWKNTVRILWRKYLSRLGCRLQRKTICGRKNKNPFCPNIFRLCNAPRGDQNNCKQICGGVTIAHTSQEISPFSVTSFFEVGLTLGLIGEEDMISFSDKMLRDGPS